MTDHGHLADEYVLTGLTGWSNLDARGIMVKRGYVSLMVGVSGTAVHGDPPTVQHDIGIDIGEDGSVRCTRGYRAVVEDGWIVRLVRSPQ